MPDLLASAFDYLVDAGARSVTARTGGWRTERRISHVLAMDFPVYADARRRRATTTAAA